jgi:uncharacterized protein (DUF58 family)
VGRLKSEITAEASSFSVFASLENNDRVGMLSFANKVEKVIVLRKGRNKVLRMINDIWNT